MIYQSKVTSPPTTLPLDSQERKDVPLARGVLDYFPAALAEVARLSKAGNDKHNPGEDLHWARGKSMDHADCILRHLTERGSIDTDGITHSAKLAWRALALLQEELEAAGAPMARGARIDSPVIAGRKVDLNVLDRVASTFTVPPRKWYEGWYCPGCGSREVWDIYDAEHPAFNGSTVGPRCNSSLCSAYMVRV